MTAQNMRVDVGGLAFRCVVQGPPGAPWLVFSNSLLTRLEMWDEQAAALAAGWRILRYDQRGHGGTAVPPGPADFAQLADDAAALMRHAGARDAVFIGISMGGATALSLAARHPGLLRGLVVCDSQAAAPAANHAAWEQRIALARAQGMPVLAQATVARWFRPQTLAAAPPVLAQVTRMVEQTPIEGFIACARALQSYDLAPALPGLRLPVQLLAGEADGALPAAMQAMAPLLPDARFTAIPEAGHLPNLENPAAFQAALQTFLASLPPPG